MTGIFVTGTDTGIGKTLVAAWLVRNWRATYWKPIQSGIMDGSDAACVADLAPGMPVYPSTYVLEAPLSPHEAAAREGRRIDLDAFTLPAASPLVVEGAGGVLVPLNETATMIDLIARLGLPALVVARSTLGTINHTLLTLEALARRGLEVAGVVMNGPPNPANRRAIEQYGRVAVLAELPPLPVADAAGLEALPPPTFFPPVGSTP